MEKKIVGLVILITVLGMGMFCGCIGNAPDDTIENAETDIDCVKNNIEQWIIETNLLDELSSCENYNGWYQIWHEDYGINENNVWVITGITVNRNYAFESTQFILHSIDAGDSWRILWRSDEDKKEGDNYGLRAFKVIDDNKIKVRLSAIMSSRYSYTLCTYDEGITWRVETE